MFLRPWNHAVDSIELFRKPDIRTQCFISTTNEYSVIEQEWIHPCFALRAAVDAAWCTYIMTYTARQLMMMILLLYKCNHNFASGKTSSTLDFSELIIITVKRSWSAIILHDSYWIKLLDFGFWYTLFLSPINTTPQNSNNSFVNIYIFITDSASTVLILKDSIIGRKFLDWDK